MPLRELVSIISILNAAGILQAATYLKTVSVSQFDPELAAVFSSVNTNHLRLSITFPF